MAKFLSETGLQTVWSKIDSLFIRKASVDSTPTANSTNPISSGGMYSVLEEIEDTVAASENALNTRVTTLEENAVTGSGLTADKLVLGNGGKTVKTSTYGVTTTIPSSSSDNTTVPTSKAVWDAFGSVASALKYKGTVASNSALPATHSVGDVYVVSTAGTFAGKACEVGDYLVCKTAGTSANDGDWDVLNGENQVSNASASLAAAGSSATIATVDGTNITVTTPGTWTGVAKTGTVTSVTLTSGTGVTVSDSGTAITGSGSRTISLASVSGLTTGTYRSVTVDAYGRVTAGTNPTTISGYGITDAKIASGTITLGSNTITPLTSASTLDATKLSGTIPASCYTHNHDTVYVKLNPGTAEQTIESSISSAVNGVVEFYRSSGDHICFIGFANKQGTTKTSLGAIGFRNSSYTGPYYKNGSNYYALLHEGNYTSYVNTTNFPGLNSTGTITKVGNTTSGAVTVSSGDAEIGTSLTTIGTVGGVDIKAKIGTYLTSHQTIKQNGITGATRNCYAACSTAAGTAAKTADVTSGTVTLEAGLKVSVKFANANTADSPTLNINSKGAKNIFHKGTQITTGSNKGLLAGVVDFVYDGTQWHLVGNYIDSNSGGTVTSVTLTSGTGITVSDSGTAITSSGSRTISLTSGVATAGTYRSVTVDTYGRVTSGTNPTTISGYGITDAKIASGTITLGSNTITPLTSSSTLDATKLSGTIPSSCYTNTDIRFADFYGEPTIAAGTAAKTTTNNSKSVNAADLTTGFCAIIWHQYSNTVANPTLNVGGSGAKNMYNAAGSTRITSSTGVWAANDIVRWIYDSSLNSGSGGWKLNAVVGNGSSHRFRILTGGKTPLYSETYQGTVTSITPGTGLRNGTATTAITSSGTLNLIQATTGELGGIKLAVAARASEISVTTGGTTADRYYGVELDSTGKAFVNVPWESATTVTVDNKAATIGTSLTTIATVGGTNITAKIGSYASSSHTHTLSIATDTGTSALTMQPSTKYKLTAGGSTYIFTTPSTVTGIKFGLPGGGAYNANTSTLTPVSLTSGRNLKDSSWNDITFSPSSGTCTINAVPAYRQDALWGDWVFYWEGMNDQTHQSNGSKGGLLWKNGEFVMAGNFHVTNSLAFYQYGTYVAGSINTGTIGASFYSNNNGGGSSNSSAFFISVSSAEGGWDAHETFRFDKDGIYAYPQNGRTGITGWMLNESDALTTSEIDSILANA